MPKNSPDKNTRSSKLRRYASVYKAYIRKIEQSTPNKSPRHTRNISSKKIIQNKQTNLTPKKKNLNSYQKFVKSESKKEKYKHIPGKERLSCIADEWEKIKKISHI